MQEYIIFNGRGGRRFFQKIRKQTNFSLIKILNFQVPTNVTVRSKRICSTTRINLHFYIPHRPMKRRVYKTSYNKCLADETIYSAQVSLKPMPE